MVFFIWVPMSFTDLGKKKSEEIPILEKKWPKKGQKIKISKIWHVLFWGPLRSTLCPKISLFGQFGLELLHFLWFSGNCDFVTEMLIFAQIWREKPDFFPKSVFPPTFFAEVCKTHRYSYKNHHLIHLNHFILVKKAKKGSKRPSNYNRNCFINAIFYRKRSNFERP